MTKETQRPNPDKILSLLNKEKKNIAHLKVFLGMAAGVGKTFAMLQRAQMLKEQGIDVVLGWIETHERKETKQLTLGLEKIPEKKYPYKNLEIAEMDLDAILKRKPKVVLVDELAHTNCKGCRHEKRYQDVIEILNAGIDVYTAINVQHLDSRADTVKEITGVSINETVPDSFLDRANEIILIDLPPEELLHRLAQGKIYPQERADLARKNFFKEGNLTALREIALKLAANRVDKDLRDFKTLHGIEEAWKSSARLMVAVFASPYSDSLIRWTRQLSDTMRGSWVGVFVDTGKNYSESEKKILTTNIEQVRKLGGEFISTQSTDLVEGLIRIAKQQNVTQIIVGKTQRNFIKSFLDGGTIVSKLLKKSGDIDIYAVATDKGKPKEHLKIDKEKEWNFINVKEILGTTFITLFAFLLAFAVKGLGHVSVGIFFLMVVTLSGLFLNSVSNFFLALILSLVHNYFFIPPLYTLRIENPQDVLIYLMYFFAAFTIGQLTSRLKKQNTIIQEREDKANALFQLSQKISQAKDLHSVLEVAKNTFLHFFTAEVCFIFYKNNIPEVEPTSSFSPSEKEIGVSIWAKQNKEVAGIFTDTLPYSEAMHFPISVQNEIVGTLGLKFSKSYVLDFSKREFLFEIIRQINLGIERELFEETQQKVFLLEQADKLHRSLFDSISHELKTPLTTIKGASHLLQTQTLSTQARGELVNQIEKESNRLLEVINNTLDMTRLDSGTLRPNIQPTSAADIISSLQNIFPQFNTLFNLEVDKNVKSIQCDVSLLVQALTNILNNALFYSPPNEKVNIQFQKKETSLVQILITDLGPGIPAEILNDIFKRFTKDKLKSKGLGLGLSVAKGFIEAQEGRIEVKNNSKGAEFSIFLKSE
jgi:two-component system sensor histidine kinase KdpD